MLCYSALSSGAFALYLRLPEFWHVPYGVLVLLLVVSVLLWLYFGLARWVEQRTVTELAMPPGVRLLGAGTLLGMLCIHALFAIYALLGLIGSVQFAPNWAVLGTLFICILSAVAEELLMRGILLRVMEQWLGSGAAIGISSLLFGLLHLNNPHATWFGALAIAVEAGAMLGAAYVVYRNLWLPIGVHFGWNLTQSLIYGAHDSGLDLKGLFTVPLRGSDWLTGGSFGPEASIPAMAVGSCAALVLLALAARRGQWQPLRWRLRLPQSA
jgi:membrane protease YdiL (CAAX protease family)